MRRISKISIQPAAILASALTLSLLCAGCGKSPSGADETGKTPAKKTTSAPAQQTTPAKNAGSPNSGFLAVFSTEMPRDPFHPQIKPKAAVAAVVAGPQGDAEAPALTAALQAEFKGIFG